MNARCAYATVAILCRLEFGQVATAAVRMLRWCRLSASNSRSSGLFSVQPTNSSARAMSRPCILFVTSERRVTASAELSARSFAFLASDANAGLPDPHRLAVRLGDSPGPGHAPSAGMWFGWIRPAAAASLRAALPS